MCPRGSGRLCRFAGRAGDALGIVYDRYAALPEVRHAFAGLAAGASAMVLATALKIAVPLLSRPVGLGVALATFTAIAILRLPLPPVLPVMVAVSTLLAWRFPA